MSLGTHERVIEHEHRFVKNAFSCVLFLKGKKMKTYNYMSNTMLREYCYGTPKDRLNTILKNLNDFDLKWTALFNELVHNIYEQKKYNRRSDDIGVRVQTSMGKGSPTENRAICIMEIEAAIQNCDLVSGLLKNVDNPKEIRDCVISLDLMKREFNVISKQIDCLPEDDKRIFMDCFFYEKPIQEVADAEFMEKHSISTKIWRIKRSLKTYLIQDLSTEIGML